MFGVPDDNRPESEPVGANTISETWVMMGNHYGKLRNVGTMSSKSVSITSDAELDLLSKQSYTILKNDYLLWRLCYSTFLTRASEVQANSWSRYFLITM